ncbi:hypothetical protein BT93_L5917 [Corymbia citriodora subsp. variegata]|uniref:Uncharacterized protein n=1 Tax=Corymbia citriodora subsp. variegata TaxID=360336 RepID=A0A8T0CV43_CORYI|nr:hypothetical protein BT93_L5917 [Corymbia citriodora subsp. variegata]
MGGESVNESWLGNFWRGSRHKAQEHEKAMIGILSFEVVSLMSKVVKLWHCLSDVEILRLREEMARSVGIRKLVSEDDRYVMNLVMDEIIDNFAYVARAVVRLARRCADPVYHQIGSFFDDPINNYIKWFGWEYKWKKMDRSEENGKLTQETEVLAELQQTVRRTKANPMSDHVKLFEFQQKVMWQIQVVRNLRELSPCNRTYDYTVRLLARSLFTILEKMIHAFGGDQDKFELEEIHPTYFSKGHSLSALMQSSVHPSAYSLDLFHLSLRPDKDRANKKEHRIYQQSSLLREKHVPMKQAHYMGSFKGCINVETNSPLIDSYCTTEMVEPMRAMSVPGNDVRMDYRDVKRLLVSNRIYSKLASFYAKCGRLIPTPHTLGHAALAVHYANVIVLIEKLASSPHLTTLDMRDDLYHMLPASIRTALRARLRLQAKSLALMVHDGAIVEKWRTMVEQMLEWLAPLAHSTLKWQSERSFEKQNRDSGANVLLVQTLYFANQLKTEEAILELLVGLNHICRIGRVKVRAERFLPETYCST